MVDKKSLDITDELFQETSEESKGNNEFKFNFFSPKKSNIQSENRANTSPSSSVDELGENENPMIVTQLLKTQQELGLTKIGILEFQGILSKELQKLGPDENRFSLTNNHTMTTTLIEALNKYRNPGAQTIDENLLTKNIYSYLLLKQPASPVRMTRAATFGRESEEKYEIDSSSSPKKESLNLSKEQFIWLMPNANAIETANKQDLLKSIVDAIAKNANSDASQRNFLIEKYGQYAYSYLSSLSSKEFTKPAELANDLNTIIQKAKKSGNITNLSEFIPNEFEEEYEILQSEAPKKTSLIDKRKNQKIVKHIKPSGAEGEAAIAEETNEDFEIKYNLKNEMQKSQETKSEDLDQKYNAIIEDLKAQIEDLEKKKDEDKTTIFFLNQEAIADKESIRILNEEKTAIQKNYEKMIDEQKEQYKKLENNWKVDEEAIKVLNNGLRQLSEEKTKLEVELKNREKSLNEQLSLRLAKLNDEKKEYEDRVRDLERNLSESNENRNQYQEEALRHRIEIDSLKGQIFSLGDEIEKIQIDYEAKIDSLNGQIVSLGDEIEKIQIDYEAKIAAKNREIENYQKSIESIDIEENKKLNEIIKQKQTEIYSLKKDIHNLQSYVPETSENLSTQLNLLKSENNQLKIKLKNVQERYDSLSYEHDRLRRENDYTQASGGVIDKRYKDIKIKEKLIEEKEKALLNKEILLNKQKQDFDEEKYSFQMQKIAELTQGSLDSRNNLKYWVLFIVFFIIGVSMKLIV